MKVRCLNCGLVQEQTTTRFATDKVMRYDEKITVCERCGNIYGEYVLPSQEWGEGIVLADGKRYFRVRDLPESLSSLLDRPVKHMADGGTYFAPMREDPDMLIARQGG